MKALLNMSRICFGFIAFVLLLAAANLFPVQNFTNFILLLGLFVLCVIIVILCNRQLKKIQLRETALQPNYYSLLVIIPDDMAGSRSEELEKLIIEPLFDIGNLGTCEIIFLSEAVTWDIDISNHALPLYIAVHEEYPDQDAQELIHKRLYTTSDPAQIRAFLEADEINRVSSSTESTATV